MPSRTRSTAGFVPAIFLMLSTVARAQVITTVAGFGQAILPGDGGPALNAGIVEPQGIAVDGKGNIFFWDTGNFRVREVSAGSINTAAGNGMVGSFFAGNLGDGGPATSASLGTAGVFNGVARDGAGNLYLSDGTNMRVRKVNTAGIISTFAGSASFGGGGDGGPATSASLGQPAGIAVDNAGNVYIVDWQYARVRMVNPQGIISTVAGGESGGDGGPAASASLVNPIGIALDGKGNLYIAEAGGNTHRVRKVNSAGTISTVAGGNGPGFSGDGGPAIAAQLFEPQGLAVDAAGNLYIADFLNNRVRKVDTAGIITTIAGNGQIDGSSTNNGDGGPPTSAGLQPSGLAIDASGNLYISDYSGYRIRKIAFGAKPQGISAGANSLYFAAATPSPSAPSQFVTVESIGGPPISFNVSATTQSGGNWLSVSGGGTTPQNIAVNIGGGPTASGTYTGTITITPSTSGYAPIAVQVTYVLTGAPPATPVITDVQNGASFQSGYFDNSIWTVKGSNLASTTANWNNSIVGGALPTSLGGVTVTFEGHPAYISYISPTQINLVTPNTGLVEALSVIVNNNGAASSAFTTPGILMFSSPAFFLWPNNQAVATHTDYSYAVAPGTFSGLTTVAAKPGEVIVLWGTGFGPTTPPTQDGAVAPSDQAYFTSTVPAVTVGGVQATVYGAALAAGFAGLYQVAIQVPASLGNGNWPVVATMGVVNASLSPSGVLLAVHN
jgi:uncharacterized protein (TIGR03437 family)